MSSRKSTSDWGQVHPGPLFNAEESARRKEEGIAQASEPVARVIKLDEARGVAQMLARQRGHVNADEVVRWYRDRGMDLHASLGNAMGGLFRGAEWVFTGRRIKSARVASHANELKVWELREEQQCES